MGELWKVDAGDGRSLWLRMRSLGEGSYGCVYLARETEDGPPFALKMFELGNGGAEPEDARKEMQAARMLREGHPGVLLVDLARVYRITHGYADRRLGLGMELMGVDLEHWIATDLALVLCPRRREELSLSVAAQLAAALAFCHERGVFHLDVKPSNVLLAPRLVEEGGGRRWVPHVRLSDFGCSLLEGEEATFLYTGPYACAGAYRPPELLVGTRRSRMLDRIDVWGLGCTLVFLLRGSPLLLGSDLSDALFLRLIEELGPPSAAQMRALACPLVTSLADWIPLKMEGPAPRASRAANDLLRRLLAWLPSERPSAAAALELCTQARPDD